MPDLSHGPDLINFSEISPELSRDFRGLRAWLPIKMHGIAPFRELLDEKLDLARWICEELEKIDGIEIVAPPQLSIVAFRLDGTNELNRQLLARINAAKRVFLSGTTIGDRFVLRICVLSFRTHLDRMQEALSDIEDSVKELR